MSTETVPHGGISASRSRFTERLLLPATFITTAGNALQLTAASILVFHADSNALAVGWLFIAVAIPQVVLAVLFGRLVDRYDRRTLSVIADLVSALTALALPVWLWLGGSHTLGSYLANFLLACTAALFMPASNALVKERVRDDRLTRFNSRFEVFNNGGLLLASSLAGVLYVAVGPMPLFVFNSATFVASAALTWLIGRKPAQVAPALRDPAEQAGGTADASQPGAREAGAQPASPPASRPAGQLVARLAMLYVNAGMGLVVASTLLLVVVLHTFHKGPWLVGVSDALAFAGFLIGGTIYPRISGRVPMLPLAVIAMLGNLVCWCLEPLNWIVLMCVIPVGGICFATTRISARTLLMRASPPDRVGRVFGSTQAATLALSIAVTVAMSEVADSFSVPLAFWALGALQAVIAIGTYISLVKPMAALNTADVVKAAAAA
jgi:MFS family permease